MADMTPVAWITTESLYRLAHGGNSSRMTVPVHAKTSVTAKTPVYLAPPASADVASLQSRLAEQNAEIARMKGAPDAQELLDARELCAWRTYERNGSVMRAEMAESRLAAADALLMDCRKAFAAMGVMQSHVDRIDSHLSDPTP